MHIIVFQSRQSADIARTRAAAQAALGGDKAVEAFQEFRDLITAPTKKKQQQAMQEALEKIAEMGPIAFRPMISTRRKALPKFTKRETP